MKAGDLLVTVVLERLWNDKSDTCIARLEPRNVVVVLDEPYPSVLLKQVSFARVLTKVGVGHMRMAFLQNVSHEGG